MSDCERIVYINVSNPASPFLSPDTFLTEFHHNDTIKPTLTLTLTLTPPLTSSFPSLPSLFTANGYRPGDYKVDGQGNTANGGGGRMLGGGSGGLKKSKGKTQGKNQSTKARV